MEHILEVLAEQVPGMVVLGVFGLLCLKVLISALARIVADLRRAIAANTEMIRRQAKVTRQLVRRIESLPCRTSRPTVQPARDAEPELHPHSICIRKG